MEGQRKNLLAPSSEGTGERQGFAARQDFGARFAAHQHIGHEWIRVNADLDWCMDMFVHDPKRAS
jgi:hypothetical protein